MRIQFFSDLHTEFGPVHLRPHQADVVVLAGDIGAGSKVLRWIEQQFPDISVAYVLGNHEFYGSSVETTWEQMRARCPIDAVKNTMEVRVSPISYSVCARFTHSSKSVFAGESQFSTVPPPSRLKPSAPTPEAFSISSGSARHSSSTMSALGTSPL